MMAVPWPRAMPTAHGARPIFPAHGDSRPAEGLIGVPAASQTWAWFMPSSPDAHAFGVN